jgi:hypothetical protein
MTELLVNGFRGRTIEVAGEAAQRDAKDIAMVNLAPHSLSQLEPEVMQAFNILRP